MYHQSKQVNFSLNLIKVFVIQKRFMCQFELDTKSLIILAVCGRSTSLMLYMYLKKSESILWCRYFTKKNVKMKNPPKYYHFIINFRKLKCLYQFTNPRKSSVTVSFRKVGRTKFRFLFLIPGFRKIQI